MEFSGLGRLAVAHLMPGVMNLRDLMETQKQNSLFRDVFLIIASSFLTAYFSISVYGERLEVKKSELVVEQKIIENQMRVVGEIAETSGKLHNDAAIFRQYDLFVGHVPKEAIEIAKSLEPSNISRKDIIKAQLEFQSVLFSSEPFIPKELFELLIQYSSKINQFIHLQPNSSNELIDLYQDAGADYRSALGIIREMYELPRPKNS